ncbi:uncharacterized protein LOC134702406 isoform X1 [Mytilus trossulus]|uniref:uncharacterized protein LOC134686533 isoform X1 n=1 Tax=Mytilus trossulus TaxID=6551 RepID=UPI003006C06F
MTAVVHIWLLVLSIGFSKTLTFLDPESDTEAIEKLRVIKRQVCNWNSLYHQQLRSYINQCSGWNRRCIPWSSELKYSCCDSLSCRCNFWGQNCKCVSRLWG